MQLPRADSCLGESGATICGSHRARSQERKEYGSTEPSEPYKHVERRPRSHCLILFAHKIHRLHGRPQISKSYESYATPVITTAHQGASKSAVSTRRCQISSVAVPAPCHAVPSLVPAGGRVRRGQSGCRSKDPKATNRQGLLSCQVCCLPS